jgi:phage repressor protein C with HTH and peptisase S24 domain
MDKSSMLIALIGQYTNGNKSQFANMLGVSAQTISAWISRNSFDAELIYAKCKGVSANWLLTGTGEMLHDPVTQMASPVVKEVFPLRTDRKIEIQTVPLFELDATAGLVALFDSSVKHIPISHLQIPDLPPCDGALYVRGDSMYPLLKSGDIVLYKEVPNISDSILWGEMYLLSFEIDGEDYISIKYIQRADDSQYIRLVSHNPHHSPKDIPASSVRALALIKASVRFNTMG